MAIYVYANLNGETKYVATNDIVFNGTWSSGITYFPPMDAVNYGSSQYLVLISNSGSAPLSSDSWSELVLFRADPNPPGPDPVAEQALELAEQAYTLACIGTNVGTNALELAQLAISQSGSAAYSLASIGTNVGTNALNAAAAAQATANSALSGVNGITVISVAGTNLATEALNIAIAGTNLARSAFNLAALGTNVGTNALNAASAAQVTANNAIGGLNGVTIMATAGTNLAQSAFNIACIGTNVGSNAFTLATTGSNIAFSGSVLSWYAANAHQKITTLAADPNAANVFPFDRTLGCTFRQDPSITLFNEWEWSPNQQRWYQTIAP